MVRRYAKEWAEYRRNLAKLALFVVAGLLGAFGFLAVASPPPSRIRFFGLAGHILLVFLGTLYFSGRLVGCRALTECVPAIQ